MKTKVAGFIGACLIMAVGLGLLMPATSQATLTVLTDRTSLTNDFIDWGQFGPSGTEVNNPASFQSNTGALTGTLSQATGPFVRYDQSPIDWGGNFAVGDKLIYGNDPANDSMTFKFDQSLSIFVTQIQRNFFGTFDATITALDASGNPLSGVTITRTGLPSTELGNNTAAALGIMDSLGGIYGIRLTVSSPDGLDPAFAINQVDVRASAVPLPASALLLGSGLLGLVGWRIRKR
jgi:hypothetical protein